MERRHVSRRSQERRDNSQETEDERVVKRLTPTEERQREEIRSLKRKLEDSNKDVDHWKHKSQSVSTALKSTQHKVSRLEKRLRSRDREIDDARRDIDSLDADLSMAEQEIDTLSEVLEDWYDKAREWEDDNNYLDEILIEERRAIHDVMVEYEEVKDSQKFLETVSKEREKTSFYRKKMLELAKQLALENEEKEERVPQWRLCEICDFQFSEEPMKVPRILIGCGHTICTCCAKNIADDGEIRCPFDRIVTDLKGGEVSNLPKNFAILHM